MSEFVDMSLNRVEFMNPFVVSQRLIKVLSEVFIWNVTPLLQLLSLGILWYIYVCDKCVPFCLVLAESICDEGLIECFC